MLSQRLLLFILTIAVILLSACPKKKEETDSTSTIVLPENSIEIHNAWARPAKQGMTSGAYLTIANGTTQADTLLNVATDVAAIAEVHESFQKEDGLWGMRPVGKLPVEAQSVLELTPGGYHIMLMQLDYNLNVGDSISASLHFSHHDSLEIQIPVLQNRN